MTWEAEVERSETGPQPHPASVSTSHPDSERPTIEGDTQPEGTNHESESHRLLHFSTETPPELVLSGGESSRSRQIWAMTRALLLPAETTRLP